MSVFGSRDEDVMMALHRSFVRSLLEYCSLLWYPQKIGLYPQVSGPIMIESVHRARPIMGTDTWAQEQFCVGLIWRN